MKAGLGRAPWLTTLIAAAVLALALPWWLARWREEQLLNPALLTGWWLFVVLLLLAAFNARKKLAVVPLGLAATWLRWHVVGGFLTLALFWLHTGNLWPTGLYEQALAGAFYLLNLTGLLGWLMQRTYPRLLANTGGEIIFERIPAELARLRTEAEAAVLASSRETGSETLARHYLETLHWFFRRPRFFVSHALFGGKQARAWVHQQCAPVRRYLNEAERAHLDQLAALAGRKLDVDCHYTAQFLMKSWLLVHLPLAAVVVLLALWHLLLIYIYAR
jgi:hypothetical protein